jgi:hypothetical protein
VCEREREREREKEREKQGGGERKLIELIYVVVVVEGLITLWVEGHLFSWSTVLSEKSHSVQKETYLKNSFFCSHVFHLTLPPQRRNVYQNETAEREI